MKKEAMINDGGPAFPGQWYDFQPCTGDQVVREQWDGMSLRQYAAIHLRVPDSGVDWMDEMIRKAQRDDLAAKAMAALIAEPLNEGEPSTAWRWTRQLQTHTQMSGPDIVAHAAYMMADAMLKAQEVNVATPLELQLQEQLAESKHVIVVQAAEIEALRAEVERLRADRGSREQQTAHPAITHCDNCGCDWLDNGLNPIGCPYCKQHAQVAEIKTLLVEVDELREALKEAEDAMRFVYTSCATFPQEPQHIQNAAWRRIVNALTKARAALEQEDTQ